MNLQTVCNLIEGKSFGGRRTFADEKSVLMSTLVRLIGNLKANLDKKMMAQAVSDYRNLKEEFKDALFGILESYQKGEIASEVLESMWRSEIKRSWEKAYEYGVRSVGNPFGIWEQDKTWLKGAETEEYRYLGKFVDDIKNRELVMGAEDRLAMYVETLDGVFNHGKVDGSPEFVQIIWHLNDAKHCNSCIKFAAGSPYTRKTLPAVPKDGTSECLSHCRCFLEFRYAEEKPAPEMYVIKGPKPMVPPAGYRLASNKEADRLGAMYAEIERLRGLIQATSGDTKKELIIQRRDVNAGLIDFMEKHKIYWVPGGQTQKVKIVESIVDEAKKELLLEGGPGSGHWGHKGRPGLRGGSLPGGSVRGCQMVRSSQMAEWLKTEMAAQGRRFGPGEAVAVLKNKFPGQPEDRYGRAVVKAGLVVAPRILVVPKVEVSAEAKLKVAKFFEERRVLISGGDEDKQKVYTALAKVPESHLKDSTLRVVTVMKNVQEVNDLYHLRCPMVDKSMRVDAFYDRHSGEMVVHPGATEAVILHEFGHSLRSLGLFMNAVWAKNASTGKVSRYGMADKKEGFAEGYWMYLLQRERLRRKAPEIAAVYDKVFSK